MKAKLWGCRGSIPSSVKSDLISQKIKSAITTALNQGLSGIENVDDFIQRLPFAVRSTYGNNTPCVEIQGGGEIIICDAGSGIRDLGLAILKDSYYQAKTINLFISHLHWDHIQGFPFFIPAYLQGREIKVWGCHADLKSQFTAQQNTPFFPVLLEDMGATIRFQEYSPDQVLTIGGIQVSTIEQPHPGISYGFAFTSGGQKIVYSTDIEHQDELNPEENVFIQFYKDADLLIIDGQFNLSDHLYTKQNWGHTSNLIAIEIGVLSQVKKLCLFHSDHQLDDFQLDKFQADSQRYLEIYDPSSRMKILLAYDGMIIEP
jgi:phosphoribosyl 1,2-cyclic phosphodiesterase